MINHGIFGSVRSSGCHNVLIFLSQFCVRSVLGLCKLSTCFVLRKPEPEPSCFSIAIYVVYLLPLLPWTITILAFGLISKMWGEPPLPPWPLAQVPPYCTRTKSTSDPVLFKTCWWMMLTIVMIVCSWIPLKRLCHSDEPPLHQSMDFLHSLNK